ncbi:hypothetical protein K7W42_18435 [Deinococcus sp. HMF7604]|nr:hypothetical protein [Deinococcus betulae]MBZ9752822.1 hypothetical protein [Deinococcus betulae]
MLRTADELLYQAKAFGRNRVVTNLGRVTHAGDEGQPFGARVGSTT